MSSPLVLITLSYIFGLTAGHGFLYFPLSLALLAAAALTVAILLYRAENISLRGIIISSISLLAGWSYYLYSSNHFPGDHYTRFLSPDKRNHTVVGKIVSALDRDLGRTSFIIDINKIDGMVSSGRMRATVRDDAGHIGYGDVIAAEGRLFSPQGFKNPGAFGYTAYLARQGIYGILSVKDASMLVVLEPGKGLFRYIQDLRERIRIAFISSTTGPGSAILQAMVLGEEAGLTDEIRSRFMAAGVTHILSISGSHLGLVALLCFGLVRSILLLLSERAYHTITLHIDPKKIAAFITILPVTFYALLAGGQTATMRSLIMIFFVLIAVILDRQSQIMHSLAASALLLLIASPQSIFDISFQLSYISVLSVGYVVLLWNEIRPKTEKRFQKFRDSVVLLIVISIATSLATSPLVAYYFNQISLAGVISNMIVVPFAGLVVVPLGLSTGIISLFTGRLPLAQLDQTVSDLFYSIVNLFSRLPFAEFHPPAPSLPWLIGYALLILSASGYIRARLLYRARPLEYSAGIPKRFYIGAAAGAALLLGSFLLSFYETAATRAAFIDVGQGDSCIIELKTGERILIDGGGTHDNRFDIGSRVVAPFLWNRGIRHIDLVVLSHPHPDHMNGLTSILRLFKVSEIWLSGLDTHLPGFREFIEAAEASGAAIKNVSGLSKGRRMGVAEFDVLHPMPTYRPKSRKTYQAENNRSLVLRIDTEGKRFLFTGDIEADAEEEIIRSGQDISCNILKAPHHGSRSSSSLSFVSNSRPEIVVASSGAGNRFGHPHPEVAARWEGSGAAVYRTDKDGAIFVTVRNSGLDVTTWSGLILEKAALREIHDWRSIEKRNYKRLLMRIKNR